ncbi:sialidase family protein [Aeoliella sp.]|uniref:sialidase family protein n=1 Tax=Aeoliella sp. TaxID=2795800 RepID=UPI003CCC397F
MNLRSHTGRVGLAFTLSCLLSHSASADQSPESGEPFFESQVLFEAGHQGYRTYRIPSLVITPKGTLLAAVAARFDGHGDWSDIDTMVRRSDDGGKTWTEQAIVTDDGKNTVDNATFIVDPKSGKVYLMYQINYARAYLKVSDNEGQRWSPPREITSVFDVFRDRDGYDWEVIAMGPGHGIVTSSGRFVVPVWLSTSHKHRPSIAATIYSDDQGTTWQAGDVIAQTDDHTPNPSEHVVVELADGRVMANMRTESRHYRRFLAFSPDGANNWSKPQPHDQLVEPICMGSMTTMESPNQDELLLFCNPNSEAPRTSSSGAAWGARKRQNVTVRVSSDLGETWPMSRTIEPQDSGYSDVAVGPDGMIYVLYESGKVNEHGAFIPGNITLAKFNLAWVAEGNQQD